MINLLFDKTYFPLIISEPFACDNGKVLLPEVVVCDAKYDCNDKSDEHAQCGKLLHLRAILWQIGAGSGGCFKGVSELKGTTY